MDSTCHHVVHVTFQVPTKMCAMCSNHPTILLVRVQLVRSDFRYDVTFFSEHLHKLHYLWPKQRTVLEDRMTKVISEGLEEAFRHVTPRAWTEKKLGDIEDTLHVANMTEFIQDRYYDPKD